MKNNFNTSEIMSKAWAIYHEADTIKGLKPIFSLCLKMAWADAKNKPENILNQWQKMSTEKQIEMLQRCVVKAAKNEIGYSTEDHYDGYNEVVAWQLFLKKHGLDALVNEAWVKLAERLNPDYLDRLNARREAKGKDKVTLVSLVYYAAKNAIQAVNFSDVKHGKASVRTVTDSKGEEYSYIDTMATSRKDNTEGDAITGIMLQDFLNGRDEIDRMIIDGIRNGYKQKEIAQQAGISAVAIHKRFNKIKAALLEVYAA